MPNAETPVAANLCELTENPERYGKALVSVRAEAAIGFEEQYLTDLSCPDRRIWFEFYEPFRDSGYKAIARAWKGNEYNLRRKVTATLIGYYDTGDCFGHQCFSRSQLRVRRVMNVTAVKRRLAKDFSAYDCKLLRVETEVRFRRGHMDNEVNEPLFVRRLEVVLTDPGGNPLDSMNRVFEIALTPTKLKVLEPRGEAFRANLSPGAYVFSAVSDGFQSVSGCIVIRPETVESRVKIALPVGV